MYIWERMQSFGYQIAKFYMNARMLKMSFYIHVSVIFTTHVCSECADQLPF